jgi:hypothetical protein
MVSSSTMRLGQVSMLNAFIRESDTIGSWQLQIIIIIGKSRKTQN